MSVDGPQPNEREVDRAEVSRRAHAGPSPAGPTSRWGKPVTIAGAVVVALALLWAIVAGAGIF